MSSGDWMFVVLVSLVIGLLVGSFITEKVINWQKGKWIKEAERKDEELKRMRDSAKFWESDAHNNRNLFYNEQRNRHVEKLSFERENDALKTENGKLKKLYADEMQKRLELAELVQRREQAQKDTAEFVTEAIKTAKAEVDRGEVSSGD